MTRVNDVETPVALNNPPTGGPLFAQLLRELIPGDDLAMQRLCHASYPTPESEHYPPQLSGAAPGLLNHHPNRGGRGFCRAALCGSSARRPQSEP